MGSRVRGGGSEASQRAGRSQYGHARPKVWERGATLGGETLTVIPATDRLRPLRDNIVLEVKSEILSRYIIVRAAVEALEGTVLAIGPGTYPKRYDHVEKHKRSKVWDSQAFLPTDVKVGDTVKLGDGEITNNGFQRFWWGDRLCLLCREQDVAGVVEDDRDSAALDSRSAA